MIYLRASVSICVRHSSTLVVAVSRLTSAMFFEKANTVQGDAHGWIMGWL